MFRRLRPPIRSDMCRRALRSRPSRPSRSSRRRRNLRPRSLYSRRRRLRFPNPRNRASSRNPVANAIGARSSRRPSTRSTRVSRPPRTRRSDPGASEGAGKRERVSKSAEEERKREREGKRGRSADGCGRVKREDGCKRGGRVDFRSGSEIPGAGFDNRDKKRIQI